MNANDKILVMIPAYNEENTIEEVVKGVSELYPDYDIVVINDGSEDLTEERAKKAGAIVVTLPFHAGGTTAVLTGYLVALEFGYDYLVKIDGDGQHRPEDIQRVLQPVIIGEADICVGSRYLANKNAVEEGDSTIKIGGRAFSSALMSTLTKRRITDTTSGLRAWNRKALRILANVYLDERRLPDDSVLWLVETIIAKEKGLKIMEVPIEVLPRKYGKSKSYSFTKMAKYPFRLIRLLMEVIRK
jgi:glycosyltransferase involved in cell wall biosynthesis